MNKLSIFTNKKIIIIILAIIVGGVLFVITRPRYVFDFEGRVKLLEQVSKTQKKYPNATVLISDDNIKLPKTVPPELTYTGAKLASFEQLASKGIGYVLLSTDSQVNIIENMSMLLRNGGWEIIAKSNDSIEAKKGIQKTKIFLENEEDHRVITVAYTYDL